MLANELSLRGGSSPRMWGTAGYPPTLRDRVRFIPTHVGNGFAAYHPAGKRPVHPHACGEREGNRERLGVSDGSSPRMWGTGKNRSSSCKLLRFIPTHVGNGAAGAHRRRGAVVHPHACGERLTKYCCGVSSVGSSPRMWGTVGQHGFPVLIRRFIPTHVGNGARSLMRIGRLTVHPHACGERPLRGLEIKMADGSSPRMWGTGHSVPLRSSLLRFIPTHVGNGPCGGGSADRRTVHPHACGERVIAPTGPVITTGSSPRMWGTVHSPPFFRVTDRFIPTHVGNG